MDLIRIRHRLLPRGEKGVRPTLGYFEAVAGMRSRPSSLKDFTEQARFTWPRTETAKAIEKLIVSGTKAYQNIPGVTDRALLRLGYALGIDKKWDPSRQAYELLVQISAAVHGSTRHATEPAGHCRTRAI